MNIVNAIAKVRFASAKPQHVPLHKAQHLAADLLCLEPGQALHVDAGQWVYYVVTGTLTVTAGGKDSPLPVGQVAVTEPDEPHALTNAGEQRVVCLRAGKAR
jgi:quercetin dioxygenase-like cupin family protein